MLACFLCLVHVTPLRTVRLTTKGVKVSAQHTLFALESTRLTCVLYRFMLLSVLMHVEQSDDIEEDTCHLNSNDVLLLWHQYSSHFGQSELAFVDRLDSSSSGQKRLLYVVHGLQWHDGR